MLTTLTLFRKDCYWAKIVIGQKSTPPIGSKVMVTSSKHNCFVLPSYFPSYLDYSSLSNPKQTETVCNETVGSVFKTLRAASFCRVEMQLNTIDRGGALVVREKSLQYFTICPICNTAKYSLSIL